MRHSVTSSKFVCMASTLLYHRLLLFGLLSLTTHRTHIHVHLPLVDPDPDPIPAPGNIGLNPDPGT